MSLDGCELVLTNQGSQNQPFYFLLSEQSGLFVLKIIDWLKLMTLFNKFENILNF